MDGLTGVGSFISGISILLARGWIGDNVNETLLDNEEGDCEDDVLDVSLLSHCGCGEGETGGEDCDDFVFKLCRETEKQRVQIRWPFLG
ncbi:hypothetical protein DITRI_Ditri05aG0078700 [Diplodiscus trichospermus]